MPFMTNLRGMTLASGEDHEFHVCDARAFVDRLQRAVSFLGKEDQASTPNESFDGEVLSVGTAKGERPLAAPLAWRTVG